MVLLLAFLLRRVAPRGPLFITAATLIFAITVRPLGLVFASFVSLMVSAIATHEMRWIEMMIWAAVLTTVLLAAVPLGAEPAAAALAAVLGGTDMDLFTNLAQGFGVVFQFVDLKIAFLGIAIPFPMNIFLCLVGALVGTLIGVLPGIGPLATIAMLLPITFGLPPVGALIMLAGIYYGAQYGGSTTSILINIPGKSSSVVTTLDGHQMAKQGRAGPALAIAAIGSFIAGSVRDRAGRGARRAAHLRSR